MIQITFTNFLFIQAANASCTSSHWFVFSTRTPESISNLPSSSKFVDSFPGQFSFLDFEKQGSYLYSCSLVKRDKYSPSEALLSPVPLFLSSEALFISSYFDIFIMKLVLSSRFVSSFRVYLIFYIRNSYHDFFLNVMTSMIRKRLNFLFYAILLNEDVFKRYFEIIKNKAGVKLKVSLKN